jgi:hypothetical protein
MMYKANVDVLRSVHNTQRTARNFRMSECQTWWYAKKYLGFNRVKEPSSLLRLREPTTPSLRPFIYISSLLPPLCIFIVTFSFWKPLTRYTPNSPLHV